MLEEGALAFAWEGWGGEAGAMAPLERRRRRICVKPWPTLGAGILGVFEAEAGRAAGTEGGVEGGEKAKGLELSAVVGLVEKKAAVGGVEVEEGELMVLLMPATAMVRRRASRSRAAPGCRGGEWLLLLLLVAAAAVLLILLLLFAEWVSRAAGVGVIDCEPLRERRRARKPAGPRLVRWDEGGVDVDAVADDGGGEEMRTGAGLSDGRQSQMQAAANQREETCLASASVPARANQAPPWPYRY